MVRTMAGLAVVMAVLGAGGPVAAASKAKVCKEACGAAIAACTQTSAALGFGDLAKGCTKAILKRCKKEGAEVCAGILAPACGNGRLEFGEPCDGADFGARSCTTLGFAGGTPRCSAACNLETATCEDAALELTLPTALIVGDVIWSEIQGDSFYVNEATLLTNNASDAYDGVFELRVDAATFTPGQQVTRSGSSVRRTITTATQTLSGLDVRADLTAMPPATLRVIYTLTNPGGAPITATLEVYGNLGSDGDTVVEATSSGDNLASEADRWVVSSDGAPISDPVLVFGFAGSGSPAVPLKGINYNGGEFTATLEVTVPPGATQRVLVFGLLAATVEAATGSAAALDSTAAAEAAGLLDGLGATERSEIVNWDL